MFIDILRFELHYRLRQPIIYIFFALFFFMTFMATSTDSVQIGGGIGNVARNSPYVILQTIAGMSLIAMILLSILMGNAINRDREYATREMLYSTSLRKVPLLAGRFTAAVLLALLSVCGSIIGIALASLMPWQDPEQILAFSFTPYIHTLLIFVLPNLLFSGAILFTVATLTGRAIYSYVAMIALISVWGFSMAFIGDLDNHKLAILADPFGLAAVNLLTRYWTIADKNTLLLPFTGPLLLNRVVWMLAGCSLLIFTALRFRMTVEDRIGRNRPRKEASPRPASVSTTLIPDVGKDFSGRSRLVQWLAQVRFELSSVLRGTPFLILMIFGLLNLLGNISANTNGTNIYPVTRRMLQQIWGGFDIFLLIVIVFYGAELVWRERKHKLHEIRDTMPVDNWLPLTSKLLALISVAVVAMAIAMAATIGYQIAHGYFYFELGLYLRQLFLVSLSNWILLATMAIFTQVISRGRYLGFLLMLVYFLANTFLPAMGADHHLYLFRTTPFYMISDMNGFAHFVAPLVCFNLYWALLGAAMLLFSDLIWPRGAEIGWRQALLIIRNRWTARRSIAMGACGLAFIAMGGWIFYNTNLLNEYRPSSLIEDREVRYEEDYRQYEDLPQPKVVAVDLAVDIFPAERRVTIGSDYILRNNSGVDIDALHLSMNPDMEVLKLETAGGELVSNDEELGYRIYRLESPLAAGDSIQLDLELLFDVEGFVNSRANSEIVANGTFFGSMEYMPHIGYDDSRRLSDPVERRKRGLEPIRMLDVDDPAGKVVGFTSDADRIRFEAVVSTSVDQIAIAPGYLQREWQSDGRRYFHYMMDAPIHNFYAFLSGRYEVARDRWGGGGHRGLPSPRSPLECRADDRGDQGVPGLLLGELRSVSAPADEDHRVPPLPAVRPVVSQHRPVFRGGQLHHRSA
jgi:ABC-2 type transport system permease protein